MASRMQALSLHGDQAALQHLGARSQSHPHRLQGYLQEPTCVRNSRPKVMVRGTEVVTDQAVPEGHKGLHEYLYGEGGGHEHADLADLQLDRGGEDTGEVRMPVKKYIKERSREKKAGVYAVYDSQDKLQYIGYARSIVSAVKVHFSVLGLEKCSSLETRMLPANVMATRNRLQADAESWISEVGSTPPGNADELHLWQAKTVPKTEQEIYEDKKVKLQKAMGEKMTNLSPPAPEGDRRENLIKAITEDDWSSVIDEQTQETVQESFANNVPAATIDQLPTVSPFNDSEVQDRLGSSETATEAQLLTVASADRVLDDVRPYLVADGGNVEVVSTDGGVVQLRLQGACGTCASSSATMKMGLEKALREAFGDQVQEVKQVDAVDTSANVQSVNAHLDMLRPAIKSYGGSVQVTEISGGLATVDYKGPPTIATGIVAAIKSQFPDILEVHLV